MTVQEAIKYIEQHNHIDDVVKDMAIEALEKQIPKKVEYGTDKSWGIAKEVPVCPVCDSFLMQTYFIGNGEKTTYCDHCGHKIQWGD